MNSNKMFNQSINFSKSQTFSSKIKNKNLNNEGENNEINKKNKFSKSSNYVQIPKNFVPVLRPKKKNSQNLTPLFLNPTQEANNSYEENNIENYSSSSDIESENEVENENNSYNKNNDFYEIKVYYNLEDKIENDDDENNNNFKENENYLKLLNKNSLIENNSVSKLRKTMKNIHSQSSQKKSFKCCEDVINCNLKLNFYDDLALNNDNINFDNCFNNDLKPQKYLSFCNPKNISILAVLKKSM